MCVKVAQWCLTLCYAMDYTVHGIPQARILEWVAFPFSRGSSQPRERNGVSCIAGRFFTNRAITEAPQKGTLWLHGPGKHPGPPAWQARLLPLNHPCTSESDTFQMSAASLKGGWDPRGPGLKDRELWSNRATVLVPGAGLSVMLAMRWPLAPPWQKRFLLSLLMLGQQ